MDLIGCLVNKNTDKKLKKQTAAGISNHQWLLIIIRRDADKVIG
jgi:hypothetical protein